MKEMLVSFIIPAYNVADTIERCLDSIYTLSLKPNEFEVIVVDDCSTDNTCEIVANRSSLIANREGSDNLILLRQPENHRQGAARNRGVKVAKGDYICFVDADDAVAEGVDDAIRLAKEKQTDMTAYHYAFVNEAGQMVKEANRLSFAKGQIFPGIELQNRHPYWCSGPVAYIYSRAFIEQVDYPFVEDVLFEDSDFVMNHLYRAKRMAYSPKLGYKAYTREGSTTRSITYKSVADYLLLGTRMMALYERVKNDSVKELKNDGDEKFAESILEGACFNVERSCRRLVKLGSIKEVRAYYERVDANTNRKDLCSDHNIHRYYWNTWTSFCLRHKHLTITLLSCLIPLYRTITKHKTIH